MGNKVLRFFKDKRAVLLILLIITAGVLKFQSNNFHHWEDTERLDRPIIRSDGSGYYAYLPQHFIYNDPHYFFIDSILPNYPNAKMGEFGNYGSPDSGRMNKFFPGVAICQTPFFLAAHCFHDSKYKSDGYSYPYQRAAAMGAICFLLLGIFLCYLVMIRLKITPLAAALSLVGISLGTPLLFYTINEPLASHVYSFAVVALFIYLLLVWRDSRSSIWLPLIALVLGLIVLLRPVNGIVVLLFFALFPSLKEAWQFLRDHLLKSLPKVTLILSSFVAVILIQYSNVYYQTGNFDFNLYSTETFENWNSPPILEVLFGFRKGLFIYAPLTLFTFLGVCLIFKNHRYRTVVVLFFFALFTYITASWWCWWYGGSIGMRPMVDISILYALGLALILDKGEIWLKILTLPIMLFSIFFQLTLSHQFENGILHFSEMNKERYLEIFMKRDRRFEWMYYVEALPYFEKELKLDKEPFWKTKSFEIEHMRGSELIKIQIDSTLLAKYRGFRLNGNIIIRDKNNIPLLQVQGEQNEESNILQTDFIGMRLPSINKTESFTSDYIFPKQISEYNNLTLYFINSHGKTNLENLKLFFVEN